MSSAESSADVLGSKRQPRAPRRVPVRWARLSVSALYLALALIPPLVLRPGHSSPVVVDSVPTFPETSTSGPWYEPRPPCWITNTCPRS
jgi:hypothetical protein